MVGALLYFAEPLVVAAKQQDSSLFADYYMLLFPFLAFEVLYQVLSNYARAQFHSVVNVFFKELFLRITTALLIGAYYLGWLTLPQFFWLFVLQFGFLVVGLLVYLRGIGPLGLKVDQTFLDGPLRKELLRYRTFSALTNVSAYMLLYIDILMVGFMVGLKYTAFYSVAFYVVALMNIPRNAISSISLPVVSDAWQRNDLDKIQSVYAKTSKNQLLMATLLFVGIWANEANVFKLLPDAYADGKWVLFFAGIARLADAGFGMNGGIIVTSKFYKFDTYFNVVLLAVTVLLNWVLIPIYGISGAAMATAISLCSFNVAKYFFLRLKFGFDPFDRRSVFILLLGLLCYGANTFVPNQENLVLDVTLRSTLILGIFVPVSLKWRLSEDVNQFVQSLWDRFKSKD